MSPPRVAVVGGGPAGLMAAERLAEAGLAVDVYDRMPSVGRKFLLAGKSGLNLTHAEDPAAFRARYGAAQPAALADALAAFPAAAVRAWADALGAETFVGTSGRVFPRAMKASPLLRAWLRRLEAAGVVLHRRHRFTGFAADGGLGFETPEGVRSVHPAATVLALGGASWPKLGSDGAWTGPLAAAGLPSSPLEPSNGGFAVTWSEIFRTRFAGAPVKAVTARVAGDDAPPIRGEFVVTDRGLESGLVYGLGPALRRALAAGGPVRMVLDLAPDRSAERLAGALAAARAKESTTAVLRKAAGLDAVKTGLLREAAGRDLPRDPAALAALVKAAPIAVVGAMPIAEAISTAGGVRFGWLDDRLMVVARPGVFVAGEMLDWDAPTGGYLITACLATGRAAGDAAAAWVRAG